MNRGSALFVNKLDFESKDVAEMMNGSRSNYMGVCNKPCIIRRTHQVECGVITKKYFFILLHMKCISVIDLVLGM